MVTMLNYVIVDVNFAYSLFYLKLAKAVDQNNIDFQKNIILKTSLSKFIDTGLKAYLNCF